MAGNEKDGYLCICGGIPPGLFPNRGQALQELVTSFEEPGVLPSSDSLLYK